MKETLSNEEVEGLFDDDKLIVFELEYEKTKMEQSKEELDLGE